MELGDRVVRSRLHVRQELMATNGFSAATSIVGCEARLLHGGRSTQVWDAMVSDDAGRAIAAFRCTQMILYKEAG